MKINIEHKEIRITRGAAMAMTEALERKAFELGLRSMSIEKHSKEIAIEIDGQAEQLVVLASLIREAIR